MSTSDRESIVPGVITSISEQKKDPDRCTICIDDSFGFGIHADLVLSEGLHRGLELTSEKIEQLLLKDSFCRARRKAMRFLAYRERTAEEIRRRLSRDDFAEEIIERVVRRLSDLDLINDRRIAREFVEARIRSRGFGPSRIGRELVRMGISRSLAYEIVAESFSEESRSALAERAGRKLWPRYMKDSDVTGARRKWTAALVRRGFSYDDAARVMSILKQESEK